MGDQKTSAIGCRGGAEEPETKIRRFLSAI